MSSKPFLSVAQHSPAASGNLSFIRSVTIAAITLLVLFPKASIARTFYEAVKNFSIKANPNGPWSYLSAYLSAVPLPYKANSIMGVKGLPYWYSNLQGCCENAYVVRNKTGAPVDILTIVAPIDHLWFDPQGNANVIVRFQAPKAGVYGFAGDFLGIGTDQVSHPVSISENDITIFSGTINSYGQSLPYKLKMTLSVGDTIDFICATGARLNNLSTGLAVKISGP